MVTSEILIVVASEIDDRGRAEYRRWGHAKSMVLGDKILVVVATKIGVGGACGISVVGARKMDGTAGQNNGGGGAQN